ncbi:biopolymer transport protein ExbD [Pseudovibrio sp. Ad13]|uniref:ExbD/TolR family protein n=1 Tax=Pseudovibrio sp. Ad13 TaxID=989396 RepID=UPI0007AE5FCC|nr:biopolymer transporter ExbD [Pseudovibrio sp. Ad13]KZK86088.1 biopolymer transport protein ExbD [Pseudovibrio sp. Ad13]
MRLSEAPKRSRAPGLTSLIDVIFLLLMFFMLASTFSIYQKLDVTSGTEGAGQMEQSPILLQVFAEGQLSVNGDRVKVEALIVALDNAGIEKVRPVAIIPAKDSTVQDVVSALEMLKTAGWSATIVGN